jgi:hypothetical protein
MNIDSFDHVFQQSKEISKNLQLEKEIFSSFRSNPTIYHFLASHACNKNPDEEFINLARSIDESLFSKYFEQKKLPIGYSDQTSFLDFDSLDSYHSLINTIIFSELQDNVSNVVEIGGGFGNTFRLNYPLVNFQNWTIVDLEFVTDLQKWYINQNNISNKIEFVSADNQEMYNTWLSFNKPIDLVIGSDSLSEFSMEIFKTYFDDICKKSKYLFYAAHRQQPNKRNNTLKLDMINSEFEVVKGYDIKKSKLILFKNKNL